MMLLKAPRNRVRRVQGPSDLGFRISDFFVGGLGFRRVPELRV